VARQKALRCLRFRAPWAYGTMVFVLLSQHAGGTMGEYSSSQVGCDWEQRMYVMSHGTQKGRIQEKRMLRPHFPDIESRNMEALLSVSGGCVRQGFSQVCRACLLTNKWCWPYPRAVVLKYVPAIQVGWWRRLRSAAQGAGGPHIWGVSALPRTQLFSYCRPANFYLKNRLHFELVALRYDKKYTHNLCIFSINIVEDKKAWQGWNICAYVFISDGEREDDNKQLCDWYSHLSSIWDKNAWFI
jgi:hypothetical protein